MENPLRTSSVSLPNDPLLLDQFLSPIYHILENYSRQGRDCPEITDADFLRLGCLRTLSQCRSGRDFLQQQKEVFDYALPRTSFFDTLHSSRCLQMLGEASRQLCQKSPSRPGSDLLAAFPELRHRPVLAGDGHHITHACHALKDDKDRHVTQNSLYLVCLHSGLLLNLAPVQGAGIYRHEMPVFRRALPGFLQDEGGSMQRPIFVVDPAFIDNGFWTQHRLIRQSGATLITRMKDNMNCENRQPRSFNAKDPVNTGIDGDWLVTFPSGQQLRLIEYSDPETGLCHQFLTTELELRPGVIAWLYLLRWRIEKVFDTAKNKLEETKAWANGVVAQEIQGHFLALTHNLLVLFRGFLQSDHAMEDEKLKTKREKHLQARSLEAQKRKQKLHPLHLKMPLIVQLSVQFIRTLRNQIMKCVSLKAALPQIRAMLTAYL